MEEIRHSASNPAMKLAINSFPDDLFHSASAKMAGKYRADFYDLLKKHNLQTADFKKTG
jgi:hypothetical protein